MSEDQAERGPFQVLQEIDAWIKDFRLFVDGKDKVVRKEHIYHFLTILESKTAELLGEGDPWGNK